MSETSDKKVVLKARIFMYLLIAIAVGMAVVMLVAKMWVLVAVFVALAGWATVVAFKGEARLRREN